MAEMTTAELVEALQGVRDQTHGECDRTVVWAAQRLEALQANVDKFWKHLDRSYDIEPREYFEREAPATGDWSPIQMALHHVWKRDPKVEALQAENERLTKELTDQCLISARVMDERCALVTEVEQLKAYIKEYRDSAVEDFGKFSAALKTEREAHAKTKAQLDAARETYAAMLDELNATRKALRDWQLGKGDTEIEQRAERAEAEAAHLRGVVEGMRAAIVAAKTDDEDGLELARQGFGTDCVTLERVRRARRNLSEDLLAKLDELDAKGGA
jgi:hypothetical protein